MTVRTSFDRRYDKGGRAVIKLLTKIFIKNNKDTNDPSVRAAYGKLTGWVGIVCNTLLCAGKFIAGVLTGSVSITADAVNNLSDASSGIISLFGFKLSERSADEEHPYGHARYEYLAGFLVAIFILLIGFELLRSSVIKTFSPEPVEFGLVPAILLGVSIPVKFWMMWFNTKIGRLIDSETLRASAADSRNDVISTAAVLAASIVSCFTELELDGIMGVLVAVFIIISGIGLVRDAMSLLLGKAPDPELVGSIHDKIMSYDGVLGTHDLMIHDYGPGRRFASVHVEVDSETPLTECHEIIDRIERDFLAGGMNLIVHPDPIVTGDSEAGCIRRELNEIVRGIDERMSVHDVRLVRGEDTKVIFDCVVPHGFGMSEKELRGEITRFLNIKHPGFSCVISFESSYAPIPKTKND